MKVLPLLVAVIFIVKLVNADDICTVSQPKSSDPKFPTVDYSYVSEVISRLVDTKSVMLQYINHDAKNSMISIVTKFYGYIWNTTTFEGHSYNESSCVPYKAPHLSGHGRSLEGIFATSHGTWVYQGSKTLRGQTLNLWSSCTTGEMYKYREDYYFYQDNTPFRYAMQGHVQDVSINIIKDFFKFVKMQPDPDMFKVPDGIFCPSEKAYPNPLPMSASYHEEDITPSLKLVESATVVYDKRAQASVGWRVNTTYIQDYRRGIRFTIEDGACTRSVLPRVGSPDLTADSNGNVHMSTLSHLVFADGSFTYNGQDIVRGIPVDVYTKSGRSAEQYGTFNSVVLYMAQEKVKTYNNDGYYNSMVNPVVRVQFLRGKPPEVIRQFELYDFQGGQLPLGYPFRMEECYSSNETIRFKLYVNMPDGQMNYEVSSSVIDGIIANISTVLGVPFLRVQVDVNGDGGMSFDEYIVDNNQLIIPALIYARELVTTRFSEKINTRQPLSKGEAHTEYDNPGNTPTLCAEYCANVTSRPFNSKEWCSRFMFNRASKRCTFLYSNFYKKDIAQSFVTDLYIRSYSHYDDYKHSYQVWSALQTAVNAGSIVYTHYGNDNQLLGVYKAVKVEETVEEDNPVPESDDPTMNHFITLGEGQVFSEDPIESIDSVTSRSCALRCLNSLKYYCKGYHYITSINIETCQLYDNSNTEALSEYQQKRKAAKQKPIEETDIYKIRNLHEQFNVIKGRTMLMDSSDYVYTDIDSLGCAELCLRNKQIFCQSFESCGNVCLLDSRHMFNSPTATFKTNKECLHFSRIYIDDYVKIPSKKALADSSVIELKDISVKNCAHMCSTSPDYQCNVFEYCDAASTCLIVPKQVDQTSQLSYKTAGTCDMYKRRPHINRAVNFPSSQRAKGPYSPGAMGGMAIGMLILGCIILIAIGVLILRIKRPGGGDGSVSFSRKELSENE